MQKTFKKIACVFCIVLMLTFLSAGAHGTDVTLGISYGLDGVSFDVYYAASVRDDGTLAASDAFSDYSDALNKGEFRDTAAVLSEYVCSSSVPALKSAVTELGRCTLSLPEDGVYLIVGESTVRDGLVYTPVPLLIELKGSDISVDVKSEIAPDNADTSPVTYTVKKVWSGDEDRTEKRPESVTVIVYNGPSAVETVTLSDSNGWSYSWETTDTQGEWSVQEINVPEGYTPSYSVSGHTLTVTNTASLIQTGQMKLPIPLLAVSGITILLFGVTLVSRNKDDGGNGNV